MSPTLTGIMTGPPLPGWLEQALRHRHTDNQASPHQLEGADIVRVGDGDGARAYPLDAGEERGQVRGRGPFEVHLERHRDRNTVGRDLTGRYLSHGFGGALADQRVGPLGRQA